MKTLIVDVDGVILLGGPQGWKKDLEADLGFSIKALRENFFEPHWQKIVTGRMDIMTGLKPALAMLSDTVTPEVFLDYWFKKDNVVDTKLLDDIDALRDKGVRAYLATNQEHHRAGYLWSGLGLEDHFSGIFYSAEIGHKKPDTTFYTHIEKKLGIRGEELFFIDDTEVNVIAAQKRGWLGHHWQERDDLNNVLGDWLD